MRIVDGLFNDFAFIGLGPTWVTDNEMRLNVE
jgi:hypothetical protein